MSKLFGEEGIRCNLKLRCVSDKLVVKEYVNKGSKLYIEGKMQTREYEGNDGVKRYTTEVILTQYSSTLVLLDSKKDNMDFGVPNNLYSSSTPADNTQQTNNNNQDSKKDDFDVDDIPF